ncbi:transcription-repair coupling factor [Thermosipho ferrireducens]|uniref:Transcription-repair-coupling factor n=1 Tax=Thermosipho ferrireducens TaxID=2571116 RepID=A0ABX7S8B0_9BACT|nr:transcription-repair coupling factor [Thermosipho ferrireducens]QTA38076.1 transcription-repair coupling factor [Thermosipho ferrireducens]
MENTIIIVPSEKDCQLENYYHIPSHDIFPFEEMENSWYVRSHRIYSLYLALQKKLKGIATLHALTRYIMPPEEFKKHIYFFKPGDNIKNPEKLFTFLGYERVFNVREGGQFSIRGSIIDFIGPDEVPTRFELFGEEIEEIRKFDPFTQKSVGKLEQALLLPAKEYVGEPVHETMIGKKYRGTILDYDIKLLITNKEDVIKEYVKKEREIRELIVSPELKREYVNNSGIEYHYILKHIDGSFKLPEKAPKKVSKAKREEQIAVPVISEEEFKIGDIVVHKHYGIAKFNGTRKVSKNNIEREYLILSFKDSTLYVPVERLDLVQKYIGTKESVTLDKLRKSTWKKRVRKARKEIEKTVKELLRLNALRNKTKGLSILGDPELEEEFAKTFPHIETEDQLKAIEEVLEDISSEKNMDRLLAGDAGYGKTEVAMRAAFRVTIGGKQVVMLVPTTVLARQHYENFKKRFSQFGLRVELFDSSLTPKQRKKVLTDTERGLVDVVIGTHGIIKSMKFADLGLIIIDEEQKFGVEQKETLKKARINVNVLSMSATPIPRTLHMALSGLKDMSVIKTPPFGRKKIQVFISNFDERIVRQAILREHNRGGQILYVHNRVYDIDSVATNLSKIVPEVSIGIAHGQMSKRTMEKTVENFYNGKIDVLVCTSIIENGIDIPNANTIIVDDAHRYGLSQLYQLRGRVGRSNKRAFAYFFYPSPRLSQVAFERLKAIKEIMGPGSGFQIALRDMEIRGIGNILGLEQHGFINDIGFHYYFEILEEVLNERRGVIKSKIDTELEGMQGSIVIPDNYVYDPVERMHLYRRIASAATIEEINDLAKELKDRFGELPQSVENLLKYTRMRILASKVNIEKINIKEGAIILKTKTKIEPNLPYIYNEKTEEYIIYCNEEDFLKFLFELYNKKGD